MQNEVLAKTIASGFFLMMVLAASYACNSGTNVYHIGDSDTQISDGDIYIPDGDNDSADAATEALVELSTTIPEKLGLDLNLQADGTYRADYNFTGMTVRTEQKQGELGPAAIQALRELLGEHLPQLTGDYEVDTGACLAGSLIFRGTPEAELSWRCSADDRLLLLLDDLHLWLDQYIVHFMQADGDELPGDSDESTVDGDLDDDLDWEGECSGPGDYEQMPRLDYRRNNPLENELVFRLDPDRSYWMQLTTPNSGTEQQQGVLSTDQADSLVNYLVGHLQSLDYCFNGRPCSDGWSGHLYFFGQDITDFETDRLIDFICPNDAELVLVLEHLESVLMGLWESPDGDFDGDGDGDADELIDGDEVEDDVLPVCNDDNVCTLDQWSQEQHACTYSPVQDGMSCNDGLPGTQSDQCKGGYCRGVNPDCMDWPLDELGFCATNVMGNGNSTSEMVYIRPNSFLQGLSQESCEAMSCDNARPTHNTLLNQGYWVDRTEVTEQDYYSFVTALPQWKNHTDNACGTTYGEFGAVPEVGHELWPVTQICWSAAEAYCRYTGKRLLSEAEWEYGARGPNSNPDGRDYPWGDDAPSCKLTNYGDQNGDGVDDDPCKSHPMPVGSYDGSNQTKDGRSYFGVFDLAGNVAEWVFDAYAAYDSTDATNPLTRSGGVRMIRGGSYQDGPRPILSGFRRSVVQMNSAEDLGFRCASPQFDRDRDGISDLGSAYCLPGQVFYCTDNCINTPNADQANDDGSFPGDACETAPPVVDCLDSGMEWEAEEVVNHDLCLPPQDQEMIDVSGSSDDSLLLGHGFEVGDQLVLTLQLEHDFTGELQLGFHQQANSAMVRVFMDSPLNRALEEETYGRDPIDLYRGTGSEALMAVYPNQNLKAGTHRVIVKVMSKNSVSNAYNIALDTVSLVPVCD